MCYLCLLSRDQFVSTYGNGEANAVQEWKLFLEREDCNIMQQQTMCTKVCYCLKLCWQCVSSGCRDRTDNKSVRREHKHICSAVSSTTQQQLWMHVKVSMTTEGQIHAYIQIWHTKRLNPQFQSSRQMLGLINESEKLNSEFFCCLCIKTKKKTPLSESASELYRPSDRRLSAKWLPTFADRGCHVVIVTDPYGRILGFLDRSRYFSIK
jgi:hypothetical protein